MQKDFIKGYIEKGYSFFNTGSLEKKIVTSWTRFQTKKPTQKEISLWLKSPIQNYAIVCGEISNLIVFDVDTKNGGDPTPFLNRGLYEIRTPSGGYHFYTLYDDVLKSTKHLRVKLGGILHGVDIQSNKALVFAPPTKFNNGSYALVNDAPIIKLPDDLLIKVLDELEPEKQKTDFIPYKGHSAPNKGRPGDVFNCFASWEDVLIPRGWTKFGNGQSGIQYWRRPGKNTSGISASTNYKGYGLFFPYTTNVQGLEQNKGYTKFSLFVALKYGAVNAETCSKAAHDLVIENYKLLNNLI